MKIYVSLWILFFCICFYILHFTFAFIIYLILPYLSSSYYIFLTFPTPLFLHRIYERIEIQKKIPFLWTFFFSIYILQLPSSFTLFSLTSHLLITSSWLSQLPHFFIEFECIERQKKAVFFVHLLPSSSFIASSWLPPTTSFLHKIYEWLDPISAPYSSVSKTARNRKLLNYEERFITRELFSSFEC